MAVGGWLCRRSSTAGRARDVLLVEAVEVFDIELIKVKSCERQQTGFMTSTVVCTD